MNRTLVCVVLAVVASVPAIAACSPSVSAPAPTAAPPPVIATAQPAAAPAPPPTAVAAAPTKAAAAAPEAASKKVDFPVKGKAITMVVPLAPGGAGDTTSRAMAAGLQKVLGVSVEVANKAGGGGQVGMTDFAGSKADGYSLGYVGLPSTIPTYLDPERKASFNRDSFVVLAGYVNDPVFVAVKTDSPYKGLKDLVDAARAKPGQVRMATSGGIMSLTHMPILSLQKDSGVKFAIVQFDSGGESMTSLLGGHVDAALGSGGSVAGQVKGGLARLVAVLAKEDSPFFPGVKSSQSQGFNLFTSNYGSTAVPAGTPAEIVGILRDAAEKTVKTDADFKSRLETMGMAPHYYSPEEFMTIWRDQEAVVKTLIPLAKEQ